jgi:hypothetical protein
MRSGFGRRRVVDQGLVEPEALQSRSGAGAPSRASSTGASGRCADACRPGLRPAAAPAEAAPSIARISERNSPSVLYWRATLRRTSAASSLARQLPPCPRSPCRRCRAPSARRATPRATCWSGTSSAVRAPSSGSKCFGRSARSAACSLSFAVEGAGAEFAVDARHARRRARPCPCRTCRRGGCTRPPGRWPGPRRGRRSTSPRAARAGRGRSPASGRRVLQLHLLDLDRARLAAHLVDRDLDDLLPCTSARMSTSHGKTQTAVLSVMPRRTLTKMRRLKIAPPRGRRRAPSAAGRGGPRL